MRAISPLTQLRKPDYPLPTLPKVLAIRERTQTESPVIMPESHPRLSEYLTIGQAAEYLGVSVWTLRNWDKDGRLKSGRHPKN